MLELLEDAWEYLLDGVEYLFSLEWAGDFWDFITGIFEDIGDFSYLGLVFAILVIVFIYFTSPYMLEPFLIHMGTATALFWTVMTYSCSAVIGYLVGKRLWEN